MARNPSGWEALARAQNAIENAGTVEELRVAQAVLLPLQCGLTLEQTGQAVGRTAAWVARQRHLFIADKPIKMPAEQRLPRGGRRNQILPEGEEDAFMIQVCDVYIDRHRRWRSDEMRRTVKYDDVFQPMRFYVLEALQARVGRPVSMSSVYNLMNRTGMRKFGKKAPYHWERFCNKLI
ncbi:hypothetical protein [Polaromonas sp. JS666]|uniref:hypothetical protein n=1 Tax=Polaromonas sp. (strain JS666 / ATCC BAA-500) TaxID=296591 RepID=UPI00059E040F|nr:hypothetical protein [Polaromonas sp. JS666]